MLLSIAPSLFIGRKFKPSSPLLYTLMVYFILYLHLLCNVTLSREHKKITV